MRKLNGLLPLGFTRNVTVAHVHHSPHERDLLDFIFGTIGNIDPDVLIGHNIIGFDLDVLLHRARACGGTTWSKLGRLRLTSFPRGGAEA
jgi:DNA polymerase alpha subunit A